MVRLELDQVVMRRMKDEDIEMVKALIKEGSEGTENRLILHISPVLSASSSWPSSPPSCAALVHSFILPLAIPVFLLIIFLKITMPRSTGVLGSSRPYWDYVGSSHRGGQDETLQNPYCRISGKTPANKKTRRRIGSRDKEKEASTEKISPEREQAAGQVFVADSDGEILGCIFREADTRPGEGLGRLLVQSLEQRDREAGANRVYAHVPYPSKVGEAFFRKLGYQLLGQETSEEEDEELKLETPERGFLGYPLTKVFYKDL
uniref:Uncharacterized protein n=1 Tax=Amphiprion percula TaxID=161767 RepID=A0A3P8SNN2_AMPPE